MKQNNSNAIPQFASLEAEKEYWESRGLYRPVTAFEMSDKYRQVYKRATGR
jgi:hypothetical protein